MLSKKHVSRKTSNLSNIDQLEILAGKFLQTNVIVTDITASKSSNQVDNPNGFNIPDTLVSLFNLSVSLTTVTKW